MAFRTLPSVAQHHFAQHWLVWFSLDLFIVCKPPWEYLLATFNKNEVPLPKMCLG